MKKLLIVFISVFLVHTSAEAQFFKKLKEKVEKKVEDVVVDNVTDKAAEETEKSLNKMWDTNLKDISVPIGAERVAPTEIPASYSFDWEYTMKLETAETSQDITYLIKKNAPYFGMRVQSAQQMLLVMDTEKEMMVMFLNSEGNNMVNATRITGELPEDAEADNPYMNSEIKKIGTKEILGYDCQGYQTENEDYVFTFYVTDEAGVDFSEIFQANQKEVKSQFNPEWLEEGTGLMMEMEMTDKSDPSKNVTMTCTSINERDFTIKKEDFQAF